MIFSLPALSTRPKRAEGGRKEGKRGKRVKEDLEGKEPPISIGKKKRKKKRKKRGARPSGNWELGGTEATALTKLWWVMTAEGT